MCITCIQLYKQTEPDQVPVEVEMWQTPTYSLATTSAEYQELSAVAGSDFVSRSAMFSAEGT